jgi:hypothetical protein
MEVEAEELKSKEKAPRRGTGTIERDPTPANGHSLDIPHSLV